MTLKRAILTAIFISGMAQSGQTQEPARVAVSIPPHQWLVQTIGGEHVEVRVLVTPGESPTTFLPTDSQVTWLMRSSLYFRTGMPFERGVWFDAVRQLGKNEIVDLREGIALEGDDPHIWLSPTLFKIQATTVADNLKRIDPGHSASFQANLDRLSDELDRVDRDIRLQLEPFAGRAFFVFHPSWSYFAQEYGLRQVAVEIEGKEPSDQELTQLQKLAKQERATVVFVQPQIHGRAASTIAAAVDGRLETLDPLVRDVSSNLETVAARLVASFGGTPDHDR